MEYVIAITVAALGGLAFTPIAEKLAQHFGVFSRPDMSRRKHSCPTVQWGGIAVYAALALSITASHIWGLMEFNAWSMSSMMLLSAGLLCLLGGYDDRAEIRAHWKLLGQVVAVAPIILAGHYIHRVGMFGMTVDLGWGGMVLTATWLIIGINALNLIDGMDGLASMLGITISLTVAAIALSLGFGAAVLPALALAGALAGFVVYNLPPARIYLGDCGSMVVGFVLSFLVMQVSFDAAGGVNLMVIGLLLFVPLADTCLAITRRTLKGKNILTADRGHIHHKLLDRGFGAWGVLALLGCISLTAGLTAWLTAVSSYGLPAWIALGALSVLLINRRLVGHQEWTLVKRLLILRSLTVARSLVLPERRVPQSVVENTLAMRIVSGEEPLQDIEAITSSIEVDTWMNSDQKAA